LVLILDGCGYDRAYSGSEARGELTRLSQSS
jgi:hypothetical protein